MKLPPKKSKLKIDTASQALDQMGYKLDFKSSKTDLKTKQTSYSVTDRNGNTSRMDTDQIKELVYQGAS